MTSERPVVSGDLAGHGYGQTLCPRGRSPVPPSSMLRCRVMTKRRIGNGRVGGPGMNSHQRGLRNFRERMGARQMNRLVLAYKERAVAALLRSSIKARHQRSKRNGPWTFSRFSPSFCVPNSGAWGRLEFSAGGTWAPSLPNACPSQVAPSASVWHYRKRPAQVRKGAAP